MEKLAPRRGAIAYCSLGRLGLILCDEPQEITYHDGNKGVAWVGIQLTEGDVNGVGGDVGKVFHQKIGDPWSTRHPNVVGYIEDKVNINSLPNIRSEE